MKVLSQKTNPLMKREEAWMEVDHDGKPTPTRKELIANAAKHFKAKEDQVIISKVFSEKGKASSRVKVHVYKKAEDVPKASVNAMKLRMGLLKKGDDGKLVEVEHEKAEPAPEKPAEAKTESKDELAEKDEAEEKPAEDKPENEEEGKKE
ncbi:MAG: hypothetical protein DRO99_04485 [Candidatus Aenigmatarchaeota archaeon]|nr:MAG: hypothetical protein DRO99_04485 [Candidatus Aenigmarchaeota archaeon]